ncbi:hypothetical protein MED222_05645 [Vibrio sp. MED222]|nr:hypothetical protein MED222_05645 [Vibrio sp. MED222]
MIFPSISLPLTSKRIRCIKL